MLNLPIKFFNLPDGYTATAASSNEVRVKVRGKGWNIITAMLNAQNEYNIDAGNTLHKNRILDLRNFAADNTWLTSRVQILDVLPDTLIFSFEKISFARLPISPMLQLEFKQGYGIASDVIVSPDSITISGPDQQVKLLSDIPTEILQIKNLSEKTDKIVDLKKIEGLTYEFQSASVILDIQRIVEQKFDEVLAEVLDIPGDRNVVLLPNRISVQLRGGIDVLGKLDKSKIKASVYYRDVILDTTGSVVPNLDIPENTQLVNIQPEHLKFIIKKFNK